MYRQLPVFDFSSNKNHVFFFGHVLKYISCNQVNIHVLLETSEEHKENSDYYFVIAALVIILAKKGDTNEKCLENIVYFFYLIPYNIENLSKI